MPFLCRRGGKQRVCLDDAKMHRMSGQPESWLRWKGCCDTVFPPCRRGALAEPAAWPVLDLAVLRDLPVGGGSVTILPSLPASQEACINTSTYSSLKLYLVCHSFCLHALRVKIASNFCSPIFLSVPVEDAVLRAF